MVKEIYSNLNKVGIKKIDTNKVNLIIDNLKTISKKDSILIDCWDTSELDTIRKSKVVMGLAINADKSIINKAIEEVCKKMKIFKNKKNRVVFYYLLSYLLEKEEKITVI